MGVGTLMKPVTFLAVTGCGAMVGFGLSLATMIQPEIVLNFLRMNDLGLLLTLAAAALVTLVTYRWATQRMPRPLLEPGFEPFPPVQNPRGAMLGAAVFGAGWGVCGIGSGAAMAGLGAGNWPLAWALAGLIAGAVVHRLFAGR